jgi:hypothetical protein
MDDLVKTVVGESEILLEYSRPDIYRKNAFRISALSVTSTTAEITRQTKLNEMKAKYGGKEDQKLSPFPLNPPPTSEEINNALQKLKDPEKRLIDEFFWFWPHELEEGNSDEALTSLSKNDVNTAQKIWISYENQMSMSNVSMHNLAVLSHLLALDSENENGKELTQKEKIRRDMNWKDAFKRWKVLLTYEGFWSRLTERVKQMNDARLKTGTVRRMKESLPVALLQINGMMAVEFAEKGKVEEAKRHLDLIRTSGFDNTAIEKALRRAIDPVRQRIKVMCKSAEEEGSNDVKKAIYPARRIIENTKELLSIIDLIFSADNPLRESVHDEVALCALKNTISYQVETSDDKQALELVNLISNIAVSQHAKNRVKTNYDIFKSNIEYHQEYEICFYCKENPKDEKASIDVKMHGDVNRNYYTNKITWNYRTIIVPRCNDCKNQQKKKSNLGCSYTAVTLILCIILFGQGMSENIPFLNVLALIVLVASPFLYHNHTQKIIVKNENSYTNFPTIQKLKKQGWKFGERPEGV